MAYGLLWTPMDSYGLLWPITRGVSSMAAMGMARQVIGLTPNGYLVTVLRLIRHLTAL